MATLHIGFVSAAVIFADKLTRAERDDALRNLEAEAEEGGRCLRGGIAEQFAALCDLELKYVVRARRGVLKTLRAEVGYGFAEHQKAWLRLGCEIFVEEEELDEAHGLLEEPENAASLESRFCSATAEFAARHLPRSLYDKTSCAFYLLEEAENA